MESSIKKETADFFISVLMEYEPYSIDILNNINSFGHNKYEGDKRFAATIALDALLKAGFSEDEVNPWKNNRQA